MHFIHIFLRKKSFCYKYCCYICNVITKQVFHKTLGTSQTYIQTQYQTDYNVRHRINIQH